MVHRVLWDLPAHRCRRHLICGYPHAVKAHLVQFDIAWEDKTANYETVRSMVSGANPGKGDLILLPEMFDTAFSFNTQVTADDGSTLQFLRDLARDLGVVVQGARTVAGDGAYATNRAVIVDAGGDLICEYAKIHPFTYGRESERFVGGERVETYPWGDLVVCPAVCYDLRFPELFRDGLARGAGLFAIGANWPSARQSHWRSLCIARAIENQAYVLAVNRTGNDPHLTYVGGSIGVSPRGHVVGELDDRVGVLTIDVDPDAVASWRREFPAWRDARLHPGLASHRS